MATSLLRLEVENIRQFNFFGHSNRQKLTLYLMYPSLKILVLPIVLIPFIPSVAENYRFFPDKISV